MTIKLPAEDNFPRRDDFRKGFKERLRGTENVFTPIAELLAEESEMVVLRHWRKRVEKEKPEPVPITEVEIRMKPNRLTGTCPNCKQHYMTPKHLYCWNCGIKLNWV